MKATGATTTTNHTSCVAQQFKDKTRTVFTKPTRLECMMQDFPKLLVKELGSDTRIGFTSFEKWLSISPAKNSLDAGAKGVSTGTPPATTSSAEMEFYEMNCRKVRRKNSRGVEDVVVVVVVVVVVIVMRVGAAAARH